MRFELQVIRQTLRLTAYASIRSFFMRTIIFCGISGFFAVFFGAVGSHILRSHISEKMFASFITANQYHFYHTLALLAVSILNQQFKQKFFTYSKIAFIAGLIFFSGSVYLHAVTSHDGASFFARVAPFGGVAYMLGWLFLALGSIRVYYSKNIE